MNLYAYAGNNPISFSDPFGLCPDETDPECPEEVFSFRVGPTLGLRYKAALGTVRSEIFVGATATGGLKQERDLETGLVTNGTKGGWKLGASLEISAFGESLFGEGAGLQLGPRGGADAAEERLKTSPLEGDGTLTVSGTVPLVFIGIVPVGGVQAEASLNLPAAVRRLIDGLGRLFGGK